MRAGLRMLMLLRIACAERDRQPARSARRWAAHELQIGRLANRPV